MERISRDELGMLFAMVAAARSTCGRKRVGAAIVRGGRPISIGYAGSPSGLPHCNSEDCDLTKPCTRTVHAEANAIAFAAKEGISTLGAELYVTCSPCLDCAKLIVNSGITAVYYLEEYRDTSPLTLLAQVGISTTQLTLTEFRLGVIDGWLGS